MNMQYYQIVGLICISIITKDIECLLIYWIAIQTSLVKYLLKSSACSLIWVVRIFINQQNLFIYSVSHTCVVSIFFSVPFLFHILNSVFARTVQGDSFSYFSHTSSFIVSKLLPELFSFNGCFRFNVEIYACN